MKRFMLVLLVVLCAVGVLAACAPLQSSVEDGVEYAKTLPEWVIVVGAIVLFFIGLGIIWKLIHGVAKFIIIVVLAVVLAGIAYGIWPKEDINNAVNDFLDNAVDSIESLASDVPEYFNGTAGESPTDTVAETPTVSAQP